MVQSLEPGGQRLRPRLGGGLQLRLVLLVCLTICLSACVMLSNRELRHELAPTQGIVRVGILLQRWPHFKAQTDQNFLGSNFIRGHTVFFGPWKPADTINPHAMDVLDITDADAARIILEALRKRGYEAHLISDLPDADANQTVAALVERLGRREQGVDGFLFCYYAPTLFVTGTEFLPPGAAKRSLGLAELAQSMGRRGNFSWAGKPRAQSSPQTIAHAFIYVSLSLFKARDSQPVWMAADSRVGGQIRPMIIECPPGPTDRDYPADPAMVQRIMLRNLRCRLWHLIPDAW